MSTRAERLAAQEQQELLDALDQHARPNVAPSPAPVVGPLACPVGGRHSFGMGRERRCWWCARSRAEIAAGPPASAPRDPR